jgi:hypothetical protein
MLRSKYFFQQFKEQIEEEKEKYSAHSEQREISKKKCKHSNAVFKDGEIRCPCGAAWAGPGLDRLARSLKIDR